MAYLKSRSDSVPARELVHAVFKIQQASDKICETIVANLLKEDCRFVCDASGRWSINPADGPGLINMLPVSQAQFTVVDVATTHVDYRRAELIAIAAARLEGFKITDRYLRLIRPCGEPASGEPGFFNFDDFRAVSKRDLLSGFMHFLGPSIWVGFDPKKNLSLLNRELENHLSMRLGVTFISLRELSRRLFPDEPFNALEELASYLGIKSLDTENPNLRLSVLAEVAFSLFELLEELSLASVRDLLELQEAKAAPTDFSHCNFDWRLLLSGLPAQPGVYFFKDRLGNILYVGKAKNLKSRVSFYFSNYAMDEKVKRLRASAYDIAYEVTGSELEALILEAQRIKELRPPLNLQIEVHERASTRGKRYNLILIVPSCSPDHVELFMINRNQALERFRLSRSLSNLKAAKRKIKKIFFSGETGAIKSVDAWEVEILSGWLERNKDKTNRIDMDAVADLDDCLRILTGYVREGCIGIERVIHQ